MKFLSLFNPVNLSSDPTVSNNGDLYFNTASNVYRVAISGSWVSLLNENDAILNVFHFGEGMSESIVGLTQEYANGVLHLESEGSTLVNLPLNSTEPIRIGSEFKIIRSNSGEVDISFDEGVTVNLPSSIYLTAIWDSLIIVKTEEDSWVVEGDFRDLY